jgi:hypothetical protein
MLEDEFQFLCIIFKPNFIKLFHFWTKFKILPHKYKKSTKIRVDRMHMLLKMNSSNTIIEFHLIKSW